MFRKLATKVDKLEEVKTEKIAPFLNIAGPTVYASWTSIDAQKYDLGLQQVRKLYPPGSIAYSRRPQNFLSARHQCTRRNRNKAVIWPIPLLRHQHLWEPSFPLICSHCYDWQEILRQLQVQFTHLGGQRQ